MAVAPTTLPTAPARDTGFAAWIDVHVRAWQLASLAVALMVALPVAVVISAWFAPAGDVWSHLARTVLGELLWHTLVLLLGVGLGVTVLGVGFAWLTTVCEFPGRRVFEWALMLPLALPAYVLAFVAVGLFDYSGPVAGAWRAVFGASMVFPPIRSAGGVVVVMTLAFYPYVYMLARAAFGAQGHSLFETGRVLGLSPSGAFWRVALPMARPAIAAGVALALMETLADFGAVAIFNYDTFTTAIYKAWFGLFSLSAAAQLASLLLLFIAVALLVERRMRGAARYHVGGRRGRIQRLKLRGARAWAATGAAILVLLFAFVIPLAQLLQWSFNVRGDLDQRYIGFVTNTLMLSVAAAGVTVFAALVLAYARRLQQARFMQATVSLATLGYALPGSVLAVGIMISFVWLDNRLAPWVAPLGITGPILAGSLAAVLLAYAVRFLAVAYGPVDSNFEQMRPSLLRAARSLGASNREILWRVAVPMLRPGLTAAALLVFVEVMKEMPATLLLRPFGWDTLATRIFEWTSEGQWEHAALPALTLLLVGLIPVYLLVRQPTDRC